MGNSLKAKSNFFRDSKCFSFCTKKPQAEGNISDKDEIFKIIAQKKLQNVPILHLEKNNFYKERQKIMNFSSTLSRQSTAGEEIENSKNL